MGEPFNNAFTNEHLEIINDKTTVGIIRSDTDYV